MIRAIPLLPLLPSWFLRIQLGNMRLVGYAVRTGVVQRKNPRRILARQTVRVIKTISDGELLEHALHSVMQLASVNSKRKASFCQDGDEHSGSLHMTDGR